MFSVHTEGQLVHTLPEGRAVAGVTSLGDEIYLLRPKGGRDQVEVYDVTSYCLLRYLTVPNSGGFTDMTSCEHFLCLYIADPGVECIHRLRLDLEGYSTKWPMNDVPWGVSVNASHNLIVTCSSVCKIKELSPRGDLLRDVTLPDDVINPSLAIQLTNGNFIVCHGDVGDGIHRVCKISGDGGHIINSHGGPRGSNTGQYSVPSHLAVDNNEFVFVVDVNNRRVTLLSPTLDYMRQVVSRDQFEWRPRRLCLDVQRRLLYVNDNEVNVRDSADPAERVGRVLIFKF